MAKKLKRRWCVVCVDGMSRQRKFTLHKDPSLAEDQARRLAADNKNQRFMVMETAGGFVLERDGMARLELAAAGEEAE